MSDHPTVFPALRYADAEAAIHFLESAFGAEEHFVHRLDDGTVQHAELRFGNGIVMLGQGEPRTTDVYVVVPDLDTHAERARAGGAELTREPWDTPYDSREYSARDPEGNEWHFGTYQPFSAR